jgi:nitrite reductase/ring-hydroxylating ferredoxin subunit/hemoglobin-like flavoprotein
MQEEEKTVTTLETSHQAEVARQGAEDAGRYFRYMAEYVGFTAADADAIRQTKPIIEKHLPEIVSKFYAHVLRYPPTRKFFLNEDGTLNQEYLELRMRHLTNFWLRTAEAVYDDDYARYVDYVGRAHTSRGADPNIYIAERYVIGQVGMMQHALSEAINRELSSQGSMVEFPAAEAWDKLMMVILELLARAYGQEREAERFDALIPVDKEWVVGLAKSAVAKEHGDAPPVPTKDVVVAGALEIPDGQRKIVQVDGLSIGVFHHNGEWYAVRNSCVHRGGPVATGTLLGDILTCPWHGFQFDIRTAKCVADPKAELDHYAVSVVDGQVHLQVPAPVASPVAAPASSVAMPASAAANGTSTPAANGTDSSAPAQPSPAPAAPLKDNEFLVADLPPGRMKLLNVGGVDVTVYNVKGTLYATEDACTHADGPLHEGELKDNIVTCPWHYSCFDVTNGAVTCPPATAPLRTYKVSVEGAIGRVEEPS